MRLRTFSALRLAEAMAAVRAELGPDAVIISTEADERTGEARVIAAVEEAETEDAFLDHILFPPRDRPGRAHLSDTVANALDRTGAPARLAGRLIALARASEAADPALALAAALDERFAFAPLGVASDRPIALIGPPGAGKTVTIAKLAARAALAGRSVGLITTDTARAGGVEQLGAFAQAIGIGAAAAEEGPALTAALDLVRARDLRLIDTTGMNPLAEDELRRLAEILHAAGAEPVLALPAGLDPLDACEIARVAAVLGARRLIATRLDTARRHGALLAAADGADLAVAELGFAPEILDGLAPAAPMGLARMVLQSHSASEFHPQARAADGSP